MISAKTAVAIWYNVSKSGEEIKGGVHASWCCHQQALFIAPSYNVSVIQILSWSQDQLGRLLRPQVTPMLVFNNAHVGVVTPLFAHMSAHVGVVTNMFAALLVTSPTSLFIAPPYNVSVIQIHPPRIHKTEPN